MLGIILSLAFGASAFIVAYFDTFPPSVVPPSSTAALGFISIIIVSILGFFLGVIVAILIGYIARRRGKKFPDVQEQVTAKTKNVLSAATLLVLLFLTVFGVYSSINNPQRKLVEEANTFGVKVDTGVIERIELGSDLVSHEHLLKCDSLFTELYYDDDTRRFVGESTFEWLGNDFELSASGGGYSILEVLTGRTIKTYLNYYDYLRTVSLSPYEGIEKSYLFVLSNLRATSGRTLLTVYEYPINSNDRGVVYEELLDRPGLDIVLGRGELVDGTEVVTVLYYSGERSPDYDICRGVGEPKDEDFRFLGYGYRSVDLLN